MSTSIEMGGNLQHWLEMLTFKVSGAGFGLKKKIWRKSLSSRWC